MPPEADLLAARDTADPQAAAERRAAARHLVQHPLTCKEHDPDVFRLIRRHEVDLDRWFTQRLGYRLHVDADSARLYKTAYVPPRRPLRTSTGRPFGRREYVLLALVLASTAAGPAVVSLRDLVDQVRSAAADADIALSDDATERRSLVRALQWMIDHGLVAELHSRVEAYSNDETADAVLKVRPDRIALLPLPTLVAATTPDELLDRADRRGSGRAWMRARLVEDPVLYRDDLTDAEWGELRRRLGDEERLLGEMCGLVVEARAEGVAAIDPSGNLAEQRFPTGGTIGHAALLLLDELRDDEEPAQRWDRAEIGRRIAAMAEARANSWANELVDHPDRLAARVIDLLADLRLVEVSPDDGAIVVLPAAARFAPVAPNGDEHGVSQPELW